MGQPQAGLHLGHIRGQSSSGPVGRHSLWGFAQPAVGLAQRSQGISSARIKGRGLGQGGYRGRQLVERQTRLAQSMQGHYIGLYGDSLLKGLRRQGRLIGRQINLAQMGIREVRGGPGGQRLFKGAPGSVKLALSLQALRQSDIGSRVGGQRQGLLIGGLGSRPLLHRLMGLAQADLSRRPVGVGSDNPGQRLLRLRVMALQQV